MDPVIYIMNASSWETLVLNIIKADLLKTVIRIPQLKINLTNSKRTMILLIMQNMRSSCRKIIN